MAHAQFAEGLHFSPFHYFIFGTLSNPYSIIIRIHHGITKCLVCSFSSNNNEKH